MKLKHLLLSALLLLSAGSAWADVEINETNFPDVNFRNYLLEQDYGSDGKLTDAEIAGVKSISVSSKSMQSLKGIEYFTALTKLNCNSNQLTSLDLSKNIMLQNLFCDWNQLTSLDVSNCIFLTILHCGMNQFTSLDISKNTWLTNLDCQYNQLTSLDVSKNIGLKSLRCNGNKLTSLGFSQNPELSILDCYQNKIEGTAMDALVESLPWGSNCSMYVVYNVNEGNVMTTTQVAAAKANGWTPCYFDGINWLEYTGVAPATTGIAINEENFPDEKFRNYLLSMESGKDGIMTDEEIAEVREIYVPSINIQSLKGIEFFIALTRLYCQFNKLTSLDLSKNIALKELTCSGNQLTSLDVSKNTNLSSLSCSDNQLTLLNLSDNLALTNLNCSGNQLTSLDVSKNTALRGLNCSGNQLTSFDVLNTSLTSLDCSCNQLTSLNVSACIGIDDLNCSDNQLASLDVSKNVALWKLNCSSNQLTSLDVSECHLLGVLDCFQNKINGDGIDALVESLPTVNSGSMDVIYNKDEQNVMTTTQVAAAKAKGWTPRYTKDGTNWKEYAGVDPSTGVNNVEASETDDSAPWYTINGTLLSGKPTEKGIYIHNGKKVFVK